MNAYEVNPYIRLAANSVLHRNLGPRIILDYELILCQGGYCRFIYDGKSYDITQNTAILISPGVRHEFHIDDTFIQPHIHFDICYDSFSEEIPIYFNEYASLSDHYKKIIRKDILPADRSPVINISNTDLFRAEFNSVINSYPIDNGTFGIQSRTNLMAIIEQIVKDNYPGMFTEVKYQNPAAKALKLFIDDNLNYPYQLDDLEKVFSYSKYYISKQFSLEYGMPIMTYYRKKRMEAAKEKLIGCNVSGVCEMMNFSSVYSFSRMFKNEFGITPSEYKKKQE